MSSSSDLHTTLLALEQALMRPAVRADAGQLAALLHPDFAEHGASGMRFDRPQTLAALAVAPPAAWRIEDFAVSLLSAEVALVTYISIRDEAVRARRSSVWVRAGAGRWQMRFHQGTRLPV